MINKSSLDSPAVVVRNLIASYLQSPVLWDIDFEIPQRVLCGIIGPNGSGKSTLLKSIMGLHRPDSGTVRIFGNKINEVRHRVSYVPQRESVDWNFPVTVMDVTLMGRFSSKNIFKRISPLDRKIALEALEQVSLVEYKDKHISQLSGGQQQRVFLARALAQQADLYIMDEPFAGVDAITEDSILKLMNQLKGEGKTVVIVHHDLQTAYNYFDYFILLNTRLIAAAYKQEAFTDHNLRETFGSKLQILSNLSEMMRREELSPASTRVHINKSHD